MSRITVPVLVALATVLLLGTPAWGQSAEEIEKLIADLGNKDKGVRCIAATSLARFGPKAGPAIPALIAALSDKARSVRMCAASSLGLIGAQAAPAVPALIAALSDKVHSVRICAATALGMIGHKASPAVPALIAWLSDKDLRARSTAAAALGSIGPPAVPALIEALSDDNASVRACASGSLATIGANAVPAIPALLARLSDKDAIVRENTALALDVIGTDLKAQGTVLYWVVPRAYWKQITALLALLVAWFAGAARLPRHRPNSTPKHLALMALTAAVPVALACSTVYYAITRGWAQGFLPDAITVVPLPVAAVLSVAFACALPAIWVCQRKALPTTTDETTTP